MSDRPTTHALTLERTFAAPPERVFRAWTEPTELVRWFAPNPELPTEAEVDVRVGGAYRIRMGRHKVVDLRSMQRRGRTTRTAGAVRWRDSPTSRRSDAIAMTSNT